MIDTSSERVAIAENYRQMTFRPDRPFNDLPLLPPDRNLETRRVLKACIAARTALAELKVAGQLIPNQTQVSNRGSSPDVRNSPATTFIR
jgi:hypothetical protein